MKDIGKILKNARENKEYTQKQVMELTGIHRKSLSGYENNVAEPDLSTFATLANLYGISADEALEIGEPDPSVSLLRFEFQVLSLFKELDAKHQEELLIQITALVRYLNAKNMPDMDESEKQMESTSPISISTPIPIEITDGNTIRTLPVSKKINGKIIP